MGHHPDLRNATRRRSTPLVLVFGFAALPGAVWAQGASAASPPAAAASAQTLPSVLVTGSTGPFVPVKDAGLGVLGDKPILDTPFTVNAYGRALLERQGAQTVAQVLRNDPAVTTTPSAASFSGFGVGLRGFPSGSDNVSFDGLGPGIIFAGAKGQLFSIETVEIVKGPTSLLGGFGAFSGVGGSINLVPKRPLAQPLTEVSFGIASDELYTAHLDVSRRFGEQQQFGLRLNAVGERGETFYDGKDKRNVLALAFDWRARPGLVFSGGLDYVDILNRRYQNAFAIAPGVAVPDAPDAGTNLMQPWTYFQQDYRYGYGRVDWEIDMRWTLTAQAVYGYSQRSPYLSPGTPLIVSAAGDFELRPSYVAEVDDTYPEFNGENLFLRGSLATGTVRHDLAFGYSRNAWKQIGSSTLPGQGLGPYASNLYDPVYYPEPASLPDTVRGRQSEVRAQGFTVADTLGFGPRWSLLLGARHSRLDYTSVNLIAATAASSKTSKTTPLAALSFKPTPKSSLYLSYAQGLERGTIVSGDQYTNNGTALPPIETEQLELGAKLELPGGALLTAALFDISKGLEYDEASTVEPGRLTKVQDGKQRNRGLELSVAGNVLPDLALSGGLLLLKAEIEDSGTPATSGKRPPGVPKITLPMYADWRVAALPGLSLSAGATHFGAQYVDATNDRSIPSWTRFDAGAQFATRLGGRPVTLTANVENLADKRYWASVSGGSLALGVPRSFKLAARVAF